MTLVALFLYQTDRHDILNQTVTIKKACQAFILYASSVYTVKLELEKGT